MKARYEKLAEKNAKASEKAQNQLKGQYHATYEQAVSKGQLKPLDSKRAAEMDSAWQRDGGLRENITGDKGPTRVLFAVGDELFVRSQKGTARATWETAGALIDPNASKGWAAR
jgi:hypothetical protein